MKWTIITFIFLLCTSVCAKIDNIAAISNQIMKIKPTVSKREVIKIAEFIDKYSKKYHLPANIYTAIIMQESKFNIDSKNCKTGLRFFNDKERYANYISCTLDKMNPFSCTSELNKYVEEGKICYDIGLTQIHITTIKEYGFDPHKLATDMEYSIEAGAKVLSFFKKNYGKHESKWWSRYNSNVPHLRHRYEKLIEQYVK